MRFDIDKHIVDAVVLQITLGAMAIRTSLRPIEYDPPGLVDLQHPGQPGIVRIGTGLITDYKWRNDPLPIVDRFHFTAL